MTALTEKTSKRAIVSWCFYDWANSSFSTIITTFVFAAYFTRSVAVNPIVGTSQWGRAIGIAGLLVAILSPIFGAIADHGGRRKRWLWVFTYLAVIATALLWYARPSPDYVLLGLTLFVLGTLGIEIGMVFYNAMMPSLVPSSYLGRVSGWAWGFGYLGGLAALIVALCVFVLPEPRWLDIAAAQQVRICGPFVALWLALFSLPVFLFVPDTLATGLGIGSAIRRGIIELFYNLKALPKQNGILRFLIARMIYIDGLNTLFAFGGIYAAGTFAMNVREVMLFGVVMNITAGLGAISFAWLDDAIGAKRTILLSLLGLIGFTLCILFIHNMIGFWVFAALLSLFVGPVQAASRSLMARLAPAKHTTEMFGLYAFSGKATAFVAPWLVAVVTAYFSSQRIGMSVVLAFFILGGFVLLRVPA